MLAAAAVCRRCRYTPRKWAIHPQTNYMITIETDNNALTLKEEEKALEELMQEGESAPPQVRRLSTRCLAPGPPFGSVCDLSCFGVCDQFRPSHFAHGVRRAHLAACTSPLRAALSLTANVAGPS